MGEEDSGLNEHSPSPGFRRTSKDGPRPSLDRKFSMDQPRPRKSTEKEQLIPNITNTYDNDDDGSFMMDGYKRTHSEIGQKLYPISNDNDD